MFFTSTPIARIVNLFSSDTELIDDLMPDALLQLMQYAPLLLGTIVLIAIYLPWTLIPFGGVLILVLVFSKIAGSSISNLTEQEGMHGRMHHVPDLVASCWEPDRFCSLCVSLCVIEQELPCHMRCRT